MENAFLEIVEYRNFGWNAATTGFLATIALTLIQGWSLFRQNSTIWKNRSGEPLLPSLFIYSASYCGMLIAYGVLEGRAAAMFNGLLIVPYGLVAVSLFRFGSYSKSDWLAGLSFPWLVPVMSVLGQPERDYFFIFGATVVIVPIFGQIRKLSLAAIAGSIEPRFILALMVSNLFWAIYGIATDNLPMSILNPASFLILCLFLVLYYTFKNRAAKEADHVEQIQ